MRRFREPPRTGSEVPVCKSTTDVTLAALFLGDLHDEDDEAWPVFQIDRDFDLRPGLSAASARPRSHGLGGGCMRSDDVKKILGTPVPRSRHS
jgi:hypothetical protein